MIKNYMEDVVNQILNDLLEKDEQYKNVCRCEKCLDDIKAKALNNIKPFYVTGKTGEVFGEYKMREFQNTTNIVMEVTKAIECINNNRHHHKK